MDCGLVLTPLRAHEAELREAGVAQLSVFGSTARGEAGPDSDVDLPAALDRTKRLSLLDVVCIEVHLADLPGVKVDPIVQGTPKPRVHRAFRGIWCVPSDHWRRLMAVWSQDKVGHHAAYQLTAERAVPPTSGAAPGGPCASNDPVQRLQG